MQLIGNEHNAFFDVDDTLILWNKIDKDLPVIKIGDREFQVHTGHVDKIKAYKLIGWTNIVWSFSGQDWAKRVVDALELNGHVDFVMSKPYRVWDDTADAFKNERRFIDPNKL